MDVSPHPFWIIVVLIAVQYGTQEAIFCAIMASLCLLVGNMPSGLMDFYDYLYKVLKLPVLWLFVSVALGTLRERHIREREYLKKELEGARDREELIAESYGKVKESKERLELKIASQLRASVNTYRAARAIEKTHPKEVLQGVQELIQSVLQPEKFSVYVLDNEGLSTTITHGWDQNDTYLKEFDSHHALYQEVIGKQQVLCIANRDHETIFGGQGMLAGPLIDSETGEINGMLKIENIDFLDLNLSTIETFGAICEWVGMAIVNAQKYQSAKDGSIVNPDHNLMSYSYYTRHSDYISALAKRVGFDVHMVMIQLANADKLSETQRLKTARTVSSAVDKVLRAVDLAFDYQKGGEEYSIILPATDRPGAKIVVDKLEKAIADELPKNIPANFALTVQTIHESTK
jgi:hypothetical protein